MTTVLSEAEAVTISSKDSFQGPKPGPGTGSTAWKAQLQVRTVSTSPEDVLFGLAEECVEAMPPEQADRVVDRLSEIASAGRSRGKRR